MYGTCQVFKNLLKKSSVDKSFPARLFSSLKNLDYESQTTPKKMDEKIQKLPPHTKKMEQLGVF